MQSQVHHGSTTTHLLASPRLPGYTPVAHSAATARRHHHAPAHRRLKGRTDALRGCTQRCNRKPARTVAMKSPLLRTAGLALQGSRPSMTMERRRMRAGMSSTSVQPRDAAASSPTLQATSSTSGTCPHEPKHSGRGVASVLHGSWRPQAQLPASHRPLPSFKRSPWKSWAPRSPEWGRRRPRAASPSSRTQAPQRGGAPALALPGPRPR